MLKFIIFIFVFYLSACSGTNQTLDKYFGYQIQVPIRNTSNILNSEFNKNYDPNIRRRPPENFPFLSNKSTEVLTSKTLNKNTAPGDLGKPTLITNQATPVVPVVVKHKKPQNFKELSEESDNNFKPKHLDTTSVLLKEKKMSLNSKAAPILPEEKNIFLVEINSDVKEKDEVIIEPENTKNNHRYTSLQEALKKDTLTKTPEAIEKTISLENNIEHKTQNINVTSKKIIVDFSDEIDYQELSSEVKNNKNIKSDIPSYSPVIDIILEEEGLHLPHDNQIKINDSDAEDLISLPNPAQKHIEIKPSEDQGESEKNNILNKFVK